MAAYESDGLTAFAATPRAVVVPVTREEVVAAVRVCAVWAVPFMARGSGTSLSGGAVPVEDGLVIAMNQMNRILRLDPEARLAVVEPGVINLAVSQAAAPHGFTAGETLTFRFTGETGAKLRDIEVAVPAGGPVQGTW